MRGLLCDAECQNIWDPLEAWSLWERWETVMYIGIQIIPLSKKYALTYLIIGHDPLNNCMHQWNPPSKTSVKSPHYRAQHIHRKRNKTCQFLKLLIVLWPWCLSDCKLSATGECGRLPSASLVLLNYCCQQNPWHMYICQLPVPGFEFNQPLHFEYNWWDQELTHKGYKTSGLVLHDH